MTDTTAANSNDPQRISRDVGVKFGVLKLDTAPAIEACDQALAANPNELRFIYQRARALDAAGKDEQSKPIFEQLVNAGYPAAFDNAGQYFAR